jgi:hypothetical protein
MLVAKADWRMKIMLARANTAQSAKRSATTLAGAC